MMKFFFRKGVNLKIDTLLSCTRHLRALEQNILACIMFRMYMEQTPSKSNQRAISYSFPI
jgi:hypothetical protein